MLIDLASAPTPPPYSAVYQFIFVSGIVVATLIAAVTLYKLVLNFRHYEFLSKVTLVGLAWVFGILALNQVTLLSGPGYNATYRSALMLPGLVWLLVGVGVTVHKRLKHGSLFSLIDQITGSEPECGHQSCIDYRDQLVEAAKTHHAMHDSVV